MTTLTELLMIFTWGLWPMVSVLGMIVSHYLYRDDYYMYSRELTWAWLLWPITIPMIIAAQIHEEYKQNNAN